MEGYKANLTSLKFLAKWASLIVLIFITMGYASVIYARENNEIMVVVSEHDRDRVIVVDTDSRVVVQLPENPSTGYQWELEPIEDTILKLETDTYQPPTVSVPGAGGIRVFEFRAQSAGIALIRLHLRRPWESEHVHEIFEVTVHVRTDSSLE